MLENLPNYISPTFVLTTVLTVTFLLAAAWQTARTIRFALAAAGILAFLLAAHALLAISGFYLDTKSFPPHFPLAPLSTLVALCLLFLPHVKKLPLRTLTLLSVVRIPVELVLLWLYQAGQVPQLMTFEGRNFDILSGLTAPLVAWLAFRGGKINKPLLIIWNLAALGLLINIVTNAILSLPTPFQRFAFDQPNLAVLYFPFIWLPSIIVPAVFFAHFASLWRLFAVRE